MDMPSWAVSLDNDHGNITYHDVEEGVPRYMRLGNHDRRKKRTQHGPESIKCACKTEHPRRVGQGANPAVECRVEQTMAKARDDKGHDGRYVGRMKHYSEMRGDMTTGAYYGDAAQTQLLVEVVVEGCRGNVARESGEEDDGQDNIVDAIVLFNLVTLLARRYRCLCV